jgi:hypothetical protein
MRIDLDTDGCPPILCSRDTRRKGGRSQGALVGQGESRLQSLRDSHHDHHAARGAKGPPRVGGDN